MTIVNVGANNGLDQCLAYCMKNSDSINAIHLVEPSGESLQKCREHYAEFPQAKFHQLAIVPDNSNKAVFYQPKGNALSGHSSLNRDHLFAHGHGIVEEIFVEATSLDKFLEKEKVETGGRLYIDTEGLDCQIILSLDLGRWEFKWIEFENIHADGPMNKGATYKACIEKLKGNGYSLRPTTEFNEAASKC